MREFESIKEVCQRALVSNNGNKVDRDLFYSVVDPESVIELVQLAEESITAHELETLLILVRNLTNYLEFTSPVENNSALLDRDDLIRQAKYLLSVYAR